MKSKPLLLILSLGGILCLLLQGSGCRLNGKNYEPTYSSDTSSKKILLFGVPSQSYYETTDLLMRYLNEHLRGVEVQTVASSSFLSYNEKLDQGYFHFTIANGMSALHVTEKDYSIVARAVDEQGNTGAILINKDSAINTISDLKGKTIATPGVPALPGHILQMLFLSKQGLNVNKDIRLRYFESFESVFLNVYLGRCSAGFATTTSWNSFIKRRPEIASRILLKWKTPAVIGNAVLFRKDLDKKVVDQLRKLILSMHSTKEGKKALERIGFLRFEPADASSYHPIKELQKEYDALVADHKL